MLGAFDDIQLPTPAHNMSSLPTPVIPSAYSSGGASEETAPLTGPSALGEAYYTRDLLTDPPTVVYVVPSLPSGGCSGGHRQGGNPPTFAVTFADIEPTAGWLSDRNNASLDICFMHSFGKCSGKAKEKDPRTCHQIHVKKEVLDNLRRTYVNPQRNYFCRTMKANITEKFAQVLSLLARRRFTLQYLEFKTDDIDVTSGSTAYEVRYRHWLVSSSPLPKAEDRRGAGANTDNFISTSDLCWDFALTGRCPKGVTCPDLHGHVAKALTKDRFVRQALEEMSKKDGAGCTGNEAPSPRLSGKAAAPCQPSRFMTQSPHPTFPPPLCTTQQQQQQQRLQATMAALPPRPQHEQPCAQTKRFATGPPQIQMGRSTYAPAETKSLPFQLPMHSLPPSFLAANGFSTVSPLQEASQTRGNMLQHQQQYQNQPSPVSMSGVMNSSSSSSPSLPFFVVSEGPDNVLRLIPMNGFSQYNGIQSHQ